MTIDLKNLPPTTKFIVDNEIVACKWNENVASLKISMIILREYLLILLFFFNFSACMGESVVSAEVDGVIQPGFPMTFSLNSKRENVFYYFSFSFSLLAINFKTNSPSKLQSNRKLSMVCVVFLKKDCIFPVLSFSLNNTS